jgi:hypothetical protein
MQEGRKKFSTGRLALIGVGLVAVVIAVVVLMPRRRDASTEQALRYMRSDLQGLVKAEEMTKRMAGRYAETAEGAGHMSSLGINPPEITLNKDEGWSAIVKAKNFPEVQCAVAVNARNPLSRFADDGEIVCK